VKIIYHQVEGANIIEPKGRGGWGPDYANIKEGSFGGGGEGGAKCDAFIGRGRALKAREFDAIHLGWRRSESVQRTTKKKL